jgi:hypothetical protein
MMLALSLLWLHLPYGSQPGLKSGEIGTPWGAWKRDREGKTILHRVDVCVCGPDYKPWYCDFLRTVMSYCQDLSHVTYTGLSQCVRVARSVLHCNRVRGGAGSVQFPLLLCHSQAGGAGRCRVWQRSRAAHPTELIWARFYKAVHLHPCTCLK